MEEKIKREDRQKPVFISDRSEREDRWGVRREETEGKRGE